MRRPETRFAASVLIEALASYHVHQGYWEEALYLWNSAPLQEVFRQNALSGIVKIRLAQALQATEEGLRILDQLKRNPDDETDLMLPGNDKLMSVDAEKELNRLKSRIAQLLPERRWHPGAADMSDEAS